MPLLPKRNNLDYNPDSTISASKTLTTIALENMKNPLRDPDQATLSAVEAEKRLKETMGNFSAMMKQLHDYFIQFKSVGATWARQFLTEQTLNADGSVNRRTSRRGSISTVGTMAPSVATSNPPTSETGMEMWGFGRPKGSKNKPKVPYPTEPVNQHLISQYFRRGVPRDDTSVASSFVESVEPNTRFAPTPLAEYRNRLVSRGARAIPEHQGDDPDDDTATSSEPPSRFRDFPRGVPHPDDSGDDDSSDDEESSSDDESNISWTTFSDRNPLDAKYLDRYTTKNPKDRLIGLIVRSTQLVRRIDILVVSRIKPATDKLTDEMIQELKDGYEILDKGWSALREPFGGGMDVFEEIIETVEYSDEMLAILNQERKKLMMDILIVVKSYKQNYPQGYKNDRKLFKAPTLSEEGTASGAGRMSGCGRNFYGEPLNNSRDIPSIFSGRMRDCPTKYLL